MIAYELGEFDMLRRRKYKLVANLGYQYLIINSKALSSITSIPTRISHDLWTTGFTQLYTFAGGVKSQ